LVITTPVRGLPASLAAKAALARSAEVAKPLETISRVVANEEPT
jgi:hypothetical protein